MAVSRLPGRLGTLKWAEIGGWHTEDNVCGLTQGVVCTQEVPTFLWLDQAS